MQHRFRNRLAQDLYEGKAVRGFPAQVRQRAQNKLKLVIAAARLHDLALPPGNELEALKGDRKGQHSIRINIQWRICFVWDGTQTTAIEVVDYH